ncbi:MAG: sulfatase-like hydrolase/transferase [Acidobacteria bacterium]|nr:sulfatase-like hydrolase/transferase [Acidobacteriota bacterium]
MMINRREFVAGLSACTATGMFAQNRSEQTAEKPNILIFMPDQQQGATVLPEHPCLTPNLDRFAREGLLFTDAYCPAPHCCPSRASFFTGLYPSEHGVFNNVDTDTAIHLEPKPGISYFSQGLREAGYNLAYSGKWHVGHTLRPQDVGWNNVNANGHETPLPLDTDRKESRWRRPHAQFMHPEQRRPGELVRPGWGNQQMYGVRRKPLEEQRDFQIVRDGVNALKNMAAQQKPWCLMVSNDGGHDPYDAPQRFIDLYDPRRIQLPANFRDRMRDKPHIYQRMRLQYFDQMPDDEVKACIAHYYALLSMQDELFGNLLQALEATGQKENTLVIYCSDHGDYAGAHGLWAKGVPAFREAYNIPCVVRWPKGIRNPGRRVDAFVSTTDFAPTILAAAGIEAPRMSGHSLLPWFADETPSGWRDAVFSQLNGVELYYTQRIVLTKNFKYVYNGFDFDEMYDLTTDPLEMNNLAFPREDFPPNRNEGNASQPWPPLEPHLDKARRNLLAKMWTFAEAHQDQIFNSYFTVAMAPYGPGIVLGAERSSR